jgi:fermentation-respiration switch protein FrsA (DUF1100 family)
LFQKDFAGGGQDLFVGDGGCSCHEGIITDWSLIVKLPKLETPTLILQGENDANTSADGARDLDKALKNAHTLKLYPNLGHSLGKASSLIDDRFRPMDAQPIQDVVDWLELQQK